MSRLPIRWRLTLAFALSLMVVLAAVGVFLHTKLSTDVDITLERDLRSRADQLEAHLRQASTSGLPPGHSEDLEPEETIAQILTPDGRVLEASSYAHVQLLTPEQLQVAANQELFVDRPADVLLDESVRIFAKPVQARGQSYVVLVTDSLEDRAEALASIFGVELVGLTAALLASCGIGYWVSGLALRPVEDLRRRAAAISGDDLADAARTPLPVSPVNDEIGRLGRTLNDMLDRIRQAQAVQHEALELQRQFLADASHQLRTPLAIIKAEVELAQSETTKDDDLSATMASIAEESDRLSGLTEELLLLAAADEERLSLNRESVRVHDLLAEVAERGRCRAQLDGRTITIDSDDSVITADRERLAYALGNLMDNALTHGAGNVELVARRSGDAVEIQVHDHGAGFTESYLAHPFERFAAAPSTGRGTGLGLAIVQAITEAHGGAVSLANDAGASVTLSLPLSPTRAVAALGIHPSAPATATDQEQQWSAH